MARFTRNTTIVTVQWHVITDLSNPAISNDLESRSFEMAGFDRSNLLWLLWHDMLCYDRSVMTCHCIVTMVVFLANLAVFKMQCNNGGILQFSPTPLPYSEPRCGETYLNFKTFGTLKPDQCVYKLNWSKLQGYSRNYLNECHTDLHSILVCC